MYKGKKVYCDWCGQQINGILMLNIDVWAKLSEGRIDDIMCVPCMHDKMGRDFTAEDRARPWWEYER